MKRKRRSKSSGFGQSCIDSLKDFLDNGGAAIVFERVRCEGENLMQPKGIYSLSYDPERRDKYTITYR